MYLQGKTINNSRLQCCHISYHPCWFPSNIRFYQTYAPHQKNTHLKVGLEVSFLIWLGNVFCIFCKWERIIRSAIAYIKSDKVITISKASIRSGFFTKRVDVKNTGSFKNLKPLSTHIEQIGFKRPQKARADSFLVLNIYLRKPVLYFIRCI